MLFEISKMRKILKKFNQFVIPFYTKYGILYSVTLHDHVKNRWNDEHE